MIPPPMRRISPTEARVTSTALGNLRGVMARLLAAEARAAFDECDRARWEGAVEALVELAIGPPPRG
jgi:hypothetical protein